MIKKTKQLAKKTKIEKCSRSIITKRGNFVYKQQQLSFDHWLENDDEDIEKREIYSWIPCKDNPHSGRRSMCEELKKRSINQAKGIDQN